MQQPPTDLSLIERAPLEVGSQPSTGGKPDVTTYQELLAEMATRLGDVEAENKRLKEEVSIDRVKALMMQPYADKVFNFMVGYCSVVGLIIVADGFGVHFHLSDTVVSIIAGSTAVSVIGLIGIVVGGLFGAGAPK